MKNKNVNMQTFKDTKKYFIFHMERDWGKKEKFLSKRQKELIHKVVYEMTDEQGDEWFKKWRSQFQLERIDAALWKCHNKVLRFI